MMKTRWLIPMLLISCATAFAQQTVSGWIFPLSSTWTIKYVYYDLRPSAPGVKLMFNQHGAEFRYPITLTDEPTLLRANAMMAILLTAKSSGEVVNLHLTGSNEFNAALIGPQ